MEPNKFEKDFREKLNQREIEPSNKAWDRLDAMLSVAEEKKPKKNRKWLYIAASVTGFLLIGTFVLNHNEKISTIENEAVVVEENTAKDTVVKPALNTLEPIQKQSVVAEKDSESRSNIKETNSSLKSVKNFKNESKQIAESSIIIKNNQEKQSINTSNQVAQNSKNETVDQLLESAEKNVVAENAAKPKTKVKINASDLLNQVDGELELSFREKVLTKVNKNYQTVKVALSNRNQQE